MKTLLSSLMLALSLITGPARAKTPKEATMNLSSPDFSEGGNIPEDGVPKEAKSLVLIVDDPDAPEATSPIGLCGTS